MGEAIDVAVQERFPHPRGGSVFIVGAPFEMYRDHPEIAGRIVRADSQLWLVIGVERHLPATPIYPGEPIGLWVKPA